MKRADGATSGNDEGLSRTQQRQEALTMLSLASQLAKMPPAKLAHANLPQEVLDEIDNLRRLTSHIARKRQLGFLAKVMRRHDEEAFAGARALLGEDRQQQHRETAALHRLEAWRERLLESDDALGELIEQHPTIDRQHLRSLIRQARTEHGTNKPPRAYREVFQWLKQLFDQVR